MPLGFWFDFSSSYHTRAVHIKYHIGHVFFAIHPVVVCLIVGSFLPCLAWLPKLPPLTCVLTALYFRRRVTKYCNNTVRQVDVLNKGEVIMPQSAYQQMIDMEAEQVKKT